MVTIENKKNNKARSPEHPAYSSSIVGSSFELGCMRELYARARHTRDTLLVLLR